MFRGTRSAGFLTLTALAGLAGALSATQAQWAPPPLDPGGRVCLENLSSTAACDGEVSPGAASDIHTTICVGWNADCTEKDAVTTDSNFGSIVDFTPADWHVPRGDTIPIGAIAGRYESEATFGLLNGPCNTRIEMTFTMMNASVDPADSIAPREESETDVMQPLAMDASGNGIPDGADRYPAFLAEFLSFGGNHVRPRARLFGISHIGGNWLTVNLVSFEPGTTIDVLGTVITFDPALGYPAITVLQHPTAQAAPGAFTDSCAPVLVHKTALGRTIDNPCSPARVAGANCPVQADVLPEIPGRGYPSFPCDTRSRFDDDGDGKVNDGCPQTGATAESGAQCDNDVSDDNEDSDINDGCPPYGAAGEDNPMPASCSGSDEGGCVHRSNPRTAASYRFTTMAIGQRDADGDGIENSLDICFDRPNLQWSPRVVDRVFDPDGDGLPTACDPSPNQASPQSPNDRCQSGYTGPDEDQDCFANRADSCPLKASLRDPTKPPDEKTNLPFAGDDDSDGIGDACDPDPSAPNGSATGYCLHFAVNVGGSGGDVEGARRAGRAAPDCAAQGAVIHATRGASILTALLGAPNYDTAAQGSPDPERLTTLDVSLVDPAPESPSDFSVDLNLEKDDVQFAGVAAYIPDAWGIVRGETIPLGAVVGRLESRTTIGLVGAACSTELTLEFDLLNASIDINDTVSFDDTDKTDTDNTGDYAKDVDPANGLYDAIDKYPDFNNRVFDIENLQPIRRSAGVSVVAGFPVIVQLLVFEPGTRLDDDLDDDPALGYPVVTLLQNVGDPDARPQPGLITDFCAPLTTSTASFGVSRDNDRDTPATDESGYPLNVNPQDGIYTFAMIGGNQRDADGDGYENGLDTCALDTNIGNPRVPADGDLDQDGLDASCDPNDNPAGGGANSDEDGDGYLNGQDNCPMAANGEDTTNQNDEDADQIGDICDIAPDTADGDLTYRQATEDIMIGAGGAGGPPRAAACAGKDAYAGEDVCFRGNSSSRRGRNDADSDGQSRNGDGGQGDDAAIFISVGVFVAAIIVIGGGFLIARRSGRRD